MKKFLNALLSLTLFASALAAVAYFLEKKGILKIEVDTGASPVELREVDTPQGKKTVFRSERFDKIEREEAGAPAA